jgi:hypothetical protein
MELGKDGIIVEWRSDFPKKGVAFYRTFIPQQVPANARSLER